MFVCEGGVLQAAGDRSEVCFRRSNRTFYSPLSHSDAALWDEKLMVCCRNAVSGLEQTGEE